MHFRYVHLRAYSEGEQEKNLLKSKKCPECFKANQPDAISIGTARGFCRIKILLKSLKQRSRRFRVKGPDGEYAGFVNEIEDYIDVVMSSA